MNQIYDVTIISVTGVQYFQLFYLEKITRNAYSSDMLSCNIANCLIKRQSERYILIPDNVLGFTKKESLMLNRPIYACFSMQ